MYVNEEFWTVDTMFYTIPKVEHIALFCYLFLLGKDLASMNAGSAVPSMTTEILNSMPVVIPQNSIVNEFDNVISSYFRKIENNDNESRRLAEIRDTLLPKLMSGELKVNEVEECI
jgi:type I restriction enzyme S subunit